MEIAILYEDDSVWIKINKEEFRELLEQEVGDKAGQVVESLVKELKRRAINA